jgi:beta-fructofuranosidase
MRSGNISWGHATSEDLVTWKDVDHSPKDTIHAAWSGAQAQSIGTTNLTSKHNPALYNRLGIYSGTAQPVNMQGEVDGTLLAFYTSVSELPFNWNTPPYPKGAESQSMAYSTDGGITWQEYSGNPVISEPPAGWNITGWRDPFFLPLPELDLLLNYSEPHYYVIFGSGIGGVGPRMPLYSTPATNLTSWTYLGPLWEPKGNTSVGNVFETGSWGWQFEVPDFFNLGDHWFVSTGTQGGNQDFHPHNWAVWNEGTISARADGSIEFTPISGGAADWGILYAVSHRQINVPPLYGLSCSHGLWM